MNYIAFVYSILLLFSTYFAYKKKMSKKQIHYTHHCVRLIFHLLIIYFLYH